MTDGACKLIETIKKSNKGYLRKELQEAFDHITSTNPKEFWTSGQWMTERTGGSDLSNSETIAVKEEGGDNIYRLTGYKFFTSATTSNLAFTLARVKDEKTGKVIEGSRGLSLFFLKLRNDKGELNNIVAHRLKDKLGVKK
jgi:alkylation response protein AidB-like acyl-CoA dehydrogenase